MTNFEETHHLYLLANHFDVEVEVEEVEELNDELNERGLICRDIEELDDIHEVLIGKVAYDNFDVREMILAEKLKNKLGGWYEREMLNETEDNQVVEDTRAFVEQHAEDSCAQFGEFWKKVSEIENDGVFLSAVASNLEQLWY